MLTYLKLSAHLLGLIINWSVMLLGDVIQHVISNHPEQVGTE